MDFTVLKDWTPHNWKQGDIVGVNERRWGAEIDELKEQGVIEDLPKPPDA